jgi:hypothetical protein
MIQRAALATLLAGALIGVATVPATAAVTVFQLHDHPDGVINPPMYGLRLDDLLASGEYTFSFDYVDGSGSASVTLTYDDAAGTVHIQGRAYGGRDTGSGWSATSRGWIDINFLYTTNVSEQDNCPGAAGNDIYVGESALNSGTVHLDGWGGNLTFNFTDKADASGCSFIFDNDWDSKGNTTVANDPSIWSGNGWLQPGTSGSRDWIFIGEMLTLPTRSVSWGTVKAMYR